jgi:Tfp pilus assembly protein PilX
MEKKKLLQDESGYILGLVMVFFVVFSMLGLAIMQTGWHERLHGLKNSQRAQAFAYAEGGIYEGLWRLNKASKAAATFSDAHVSVTYDSVGLVMISSCTVGSVSKTIQVTVKAPALPTGGWAYALYTDTKDLRLDEGTGTVIGDVHSNTDVVSDAGYTVNGSITTSPYVAPPTIDWNFFKAEAQSVGQYSTSTLVFNTAGSPYTGVWYTTSKANIVANVVINGTVVAEGKIEF